VLPICDHFLGAETLGLCANADIVCSLSSAVCALVPLARFLQENAAVLAVTAVTFQVADLVRLSALLGIHHSIGTVRQ
jgi:hypothetical protein